MRSKGSASELRPDAARGAAGQRGLAAEGCGRLPGGLPQVRRQPGGRLSGHGRRGPEGWPHLGRSPSCPCEERAALSWLAGSLFGRSAIRPSCVDDTGRGDRERHKVRFNSNYLRMADEAGYSPQRPETKAVERNNSRSPAGRPRTGRASKKIPGRARPRRPDRRERLLPQPARPADLGPGGLRRADRLRPASGEGLDDVAIAALPSTGRPVLANRPGSTTSTPAGRGVPAGSAAAAAGPGHRGLGRREQSQGAGGPRAAAAVPPTDAGEVAGCANLNPVEMLWSHLEVWAHGQLRAPACAAPRPGGEHLGDVARAPGLIKSLWEGSRLPFPDTKLAS